MQRAVSEGMWGLHEMVLRFQSMEGQIVELRQLGKNNCAILSHTVAARLRMRQ